ncbi:MAG: U32 family peptidase [Bacillota bacterium]|nr:U32 family peptidase [Bacillota bacterium]
MMKNRIELLAPAGDLEKLKFAVLYGADAVYIGGEFFGLRQAAKNFTREEMKEGIAFAHERGAKVYLTMNIVPHEGDIQALPSYLEEIKDLEIDAFIVSDPGTMLQIKQSIPHAEIHLSTQANTTNSASAEFWKRMGVERIVLARELGIQEIKDICQAVPEMEFEVFIHGAMCISHSGRCLLSNYLTGRDSNRGDCAQPCRWNYALVEKNRPGEEFPIEEDEHGTYIMNSKDLCLIEKIPELIESGVCSLKIEGRMKTPFYVASVVRVYREAIDAYYRAREAGEEPSYRPEWMEELKKTSHRGFTTAFFDGNADADAQNYASASYTRDYDFAGVVLAYDEKEQLLLVEQRNNFAVGTEIEVIGPKYFSTKFVVTEMFNEKMEPIEVARHAKMKLYLRTSLPLKEFDILRKESN